jgi:hypothetical protein
MVVAPGYHLATAADIVADPSAPKAFVQGIMENIDWVYNPSSGEWVQQKVESYKKALKKMSMDEIEQNQFFIFEDFLASLTSGNK